VSQIAPAASSGALGRACALWIVGRMRAAFAKFSRSIAGAWQNLANSGRAG